MSGKGLNSMVVNSYGNILVCDKHNKCIYAITEYGTESNIFLKLESGPTCLSYRESDNMLIVFCSDRLLLYKLKQI